MMFSSLSYEDRDIDPVVKTYFECRHGDIPEGDGLDSCVICSPVWTEEPTTRPAPNPILLVFRESVNDGLPFTDPAEWARNIESPPRPGQSWGYATREQQEHARKVLTRLAAFLA